MVFIILLNYNILKRGSVCDVVLNLNMNIVFMLPNLRDM